MPIFALIKIISPPYHTTPMHKTLLVILLFMLASSGTGTAASSTGVPSTPPLSAGFRTARSGMENHRTDTPGNPKEIKHERKLVYVFPLREEIMPAAIRFVRKRLREASGMGADYIVVDMNTYGGLLDAADSIRTMLLNYPVPTITFINNQAASAGALIALATDSIYMRPGGSIGAATVVDQSGAPLPDKYQSFMRSMMRATAEAHGKEAVVERGDTVYRWRRDPLIAEAMVDPSVVVPGLVDGTKVVTMTADEALRWGFSEGNASDRGEVIQKAGLQDYDIYEYRPTGMDKAMGILTNPTLQAIFIMLIIGGIYFELQTPGIGLPLIVAIIGAVLYFAPLYIEGLAANWELLLFLAGIVLVIIEIFVTPGFGVLGITGIAAIITGLAFALIDTDLLKYIPTGEIPIGIVLGPFFIVVIAMGVGLMLSIWLGNRFLSGNSGLRKRIVLVSDMDARHGYVSVAAGRDLVGKTGTASTALRPSGRVMIEGKYYEAAGDNAAFIEKGTQVVVVRDENGVLYCREYGSL